MTFHFHKWTPWSDPVQTLNGGHKQQWRVCQHCNKAVFRTLSWDKQTTITAVHASVERSRALQNIKEQP